MGEIRMSKFQKFIFWSVSIPYVLVVNILRLPFSYVIMNVEMFEKLQKTYFATDQVTKTLLEISKAQVKEKMRKK
jgi:hypothetical protein